MRAFARIAIAVAFVSAIVWFGHHSHPHNYGTPSTPIFRSNFDPFGTWIFRFFDAHNF
jgi:hypothetical protein